MVGVGAGLAPGDGKLLCCGGKRTFNEEPTDHWPLTTASVHRLQADTARAGTHFCQPLADRTVPSSIKTDKIVKSSKDTPSV